MNFGPVLHNVVFLVLLRASVVKLIHLWWYILLVIYYFVIHIDYFVMYCFIVHLL